VLPALVDRLEAVTVGIENVRSVITWIVIQARAGLAVVGRARRYCWFVERVHLGLALGDKADMRSPAVGIALLEPEEYAAVPSEGLEVAFRGSGPGYSVEPTSKTWSVACLLFCLRAQFGRTNLNPSRYELRSN